MTEHFHTVVIGGGCLGCASAISLARQLRGSGREVCIIDKAVVGAGLSARHSGIVRAVNTSKTAAQLAASSTRVWKTLKDLWGVTIPFTQTGALWITPATSETQRKAWPALSRLLKTTGVTFIEVNSNEAAAITHDNVRISNQERYYFEPEALLFDPLEVLHGLSQSLRIQGVKVFEHTTVYGFGRDENEKITRIHSDRGDFSCDYVVNAAGAWSPKLFAPLGIEIPVKLEPVFVAEWLLGASPFPKDFPIVADFTNRAYFRAWRGPVLHMHQPRNRQQDATRLKLQEPVDGDLIYKSGNTHPVIGQIEAYREKLTNRFPSVIAPVCLSAYNTYFDVTPDLNFILGKDPDIPNLFHSMGGGQAFKYAPVFGEILANLIVHPTYRYENIELSQFSIERFRRYEPYRPSLHAASANTL